MTLQLSALPISSLLPSSSSSSTKRDIVWREHISVLPPSNTEQHTSPVSLLALLAARSKKEKQKECTTRTPPLLPSFPTRPAGGGEKSAAAMLGLAQWQVRPSAAAGACPWAAARARAARSRCSCWGEPRGAGGPWNILACAALIAGCRPCCTGCVTQCRSAGPGTETRTGWASAACSASGNECSVQPERRPPSPQPSAAE